ncbi:UDP-glucuronosyltransferase 2A1-like isoform X3 [Narcine bancroftii]|uniref:UDP-glucuronosyltransferase 2A1-like isoform X3 n=1 Tax=Narcine bancroftii TaxID=1343680 RepID=UPI0038314E48
MKLIWLLMAFCSLHRFKAGKVLIWSAEGSHWINLKYIIHKLLARGHDVTVAVHSATVYINLTEPSLIKYEVIQVPFTRERFDNFMNTLLDFWVYEKPQLSHWSSYRRFSEIVEDMKVLNKQHCDGLFRNRTLMQKLRDSRFEVVLIDPMFPCGDLLALKLGVPFILTLRFTPAFTAERLCGQLPAPPSYVPATLSELSNDMSFTERIQNVLYMIMYDWVIKQMWRHWDSYYSEVLIWSADASHWINLKSIIHKLIERGHNVTVAVRSATPFINFSEPSPITFEIFQVPFTAKMYNDVLMANLDFWLYEKPQLSHWSSYRRFSAVVGEMEKLSKEQCDGLLRNRTLMQKLRASRFEVVLIDPVFPCGDLLALKLGVPFIFTLRFTPAFTAERLCGQLPAPPSYVPATLSELSNDMTFTERIQNVLYTIMYDWIMKQMWRHWDSYYSEVLGEPTTLCEVMGKADIWLIRTYWDFEFPRPLLPNFVFVGGLHCQPSKPLPQVLWRYAGEAPKTLASNTKLYNWLPQNDLLGHPKTRAFITHGGTNGIYEAIYHGVPIIGIPLFADQPDNMVHMKAKGVAVVLQFPTLTRQDLVDALNTVINDTRYKENAMKLFQIQHDQPTGPLNRSVFWIEFVIRHGGAKHLRPAAHSLSWPQYHCLDVMAFLAACFAVFLILLTKCCLFCCRKCMHMKVQKDKIQ